MEVRVSARKLAWPSVCACCCGPADTSQDADHTRTTGKRVIRSDTRSWSIPYCRACLDHQDLWEEVAALQARLSRLRGARVLVPLMLVFFAFLCPFGCVSSVTQPEKADEKPLPGQRLSREQGITAALCVGIPGFLVLAGGAVWAFFGIGGAIGRAEKAVDRARDDAEALMVDSCACRGPAVEYLGWYGSIHTFDFASRAYGQQFAQANARKLVD